MYSEDEIWFSSPQDLWMCNHCSDPLMNYICQSFRWFSVKEDAVRHVQTEYVRVPIFLRLLSSRLILHF